MTKRYMYDCAEESCTKTADDEPLWRINEKGERGVFMCEEHAREFKEAQ